MVSCSLRLKLVPYLVTIIRVWSWSGLWQSVHGWHSQFAAITFHQPRRLLSRPESITVLWPVTNYTAWW